MSFKNGIASLAIAEILPEDAGEYICRATNSEGTDETSCIITVEHSRVAKPDADVKAEAAVTESPAAVASGAPSAAAPESGSESAPTFTRHLQSANCNDGDAVTLECQISGDPAVDAVWLHNDREIKSSDDFKYVHEGNTFKLQISEIFPEDFGTYTCKSFSRKCLLFAEILLIPCRRGFQCSWRSKQQLLINCRR